MRTRASILILVGFLLLGGMLVLLRARREEAGGITSADPSHPAPSSATKVAVPLLFSTEKEEWLREAIADFEKVHPEIDVQLEGKGSLEAIRALLAGEKKPVLWSPADSLAVNLFAVQWQLARGVDPIV